MIGEQLKKVRFCLIYILFIIGIAFPIHANAKDIIVVVDPGHGGDNLGGNTDVYTEKELTMKVAESLKERLSEYDGVQVYLTHEDIDSKDLSRSERAKIAANYDADILVSLHFNMSENHNLYGSEVWTSAFDRYYKTGTELGNIVMDGLVNDMHFFNRGVKTRISDKTGEDYYGIIGLARKQGIPSIIIEHCHMDEERDYTFLESNEDPYKLFGYNDADSIAKYYHLKSEELGLDYTDYEYTRVEEPSSPVYPDYSEPDVCEIELIDTDSESNTASVRVHAYDSDGLVQYYSYSYDGGEHYSILYPWSEDSTANNPVSDDELVVHIPLPEQDNSTLVFRVYNQYERMTESNILEGIPAAIVEQTDESEDIIQDNTRLIEYELNGSDNRSNNNLFNIIMTILFFLIVIGSVIVIIQFIKMINKSARRK